MNNVEEPQEEEYKKNIWEEIRLIKETQQQHAAAIRELQTNRQGPQTAPNPQNP